MACNPKLYMAVVVANMLAVYASLVPNGTTGCEKFHGCPTWAVRNHTFALAQTCALRGWPSGSAEALMCATIGVATRTMDAVVPSSQGQRGYCGFGSSYASEWLAGLHTAVEGCAIVLFTVIVGHSDTLSTIPADEPSSDERSICAIALLDAQSALPADAGAELPNALQSGPSTWFRFSLPKMPMFASAGRAAHSMKAAMLSLFPSADWVVYADGKTVLNVPPRALIHRLTALTSLPLIVFQHPWNDSPELEGKYSRIRVRYQHRSAWQNDITDIRRVEALYRREGAYNNQPGMLDAFVIAQQRMPSSRQLAVLRGATGLERPAHRTLLQAFECAWFCEIALLSMREQVSFYYVLDMLGARRHTFVVPALLYLRNRDGKSIPWFQTKEHGAG